METSLNVALKEQEEKSVELAAARVKHDLICSPPTSFHAFQSTIRLQRFSSWLNCSMPNCEHGHGKNSLRSCEKWFLIFAQEQLAIYGDHNPPLALISLCCINCRPSWIEGRWAVKPQVRGPSRVRSLFVYKKHCCLGVSILSLIKLLI